ncbi:hypothetical protein BH11MYX1_BH11MYX1_55420 [soil metagenome]
MRRLSWILGCGLFARIASADGGTDADRLFEEGRALAKAGNYAEACDRFAQSLVIERTIGTELNLGDCHEQLGQVRAAWELYASAASDAEAAHDEKRSAFAHDRVRAIEAKMTTLIVRLAEPDRDGLTLTIGGRALAPTSELREHVAPGPIEIDETAPGIAPVRRREVGGAGMTLVIELPALPRPAQSVPTATVGTAGSRDATRARISYALAAVGGGSAVTALVLTLVARRHYTTAANGMNCMETAAGLACNDTGAGAVHDAQHLADLGTGFAITSAAFLASAIVVHLTARRAADRIYVRPQASPHAAALVLGGSF